MDIISELHSCCAVFVSYNPEYEFVNNVNQIVNQVCEVLIVDNNSGQSSSIFLEELNQNSKVTIIYNKYNLGIAAALNQGVDYAIKHNYEWIATFDQDSKAPTDFIKSMFTTYDRYYLKDKIAIISPCYTDKVYGLTMPGGKDVSVNIDYEVTTTMTSGNLVKTSIFKNLGLFSENFFIDYVDNEFCLRCQVNGFKIIVSCSSLLDHSLGNITSHYFLGKTYFTTNHSPVRKFYKTRNRLLVYQKYLFSNSEIFYSQSVRAWILQDILTFFKETLLILLLEDNRRMKIKLIFKGIIHGFQRKEGVYNDAK